VTVDLSMVDDELVRRAQAGDRRAFDVLVLRHRGPIFGLARRILRNPEAAEDATQEAFLRAYLRLDSFHGGAFRSWLFTIVANEARDELRRMRRRPLTIYPWPDRPLDIADPGLLPEALAESAELRTFLDARLARLPAAQRRAVELAGLDGLPYREVAREAGVPIGTVKSQVSRGRHKLRALIGSELPASPRRGDRTNPGFVPRREMADAI